MHITTAVLLFWLFILLVYDILADAGTIPGAITITETIRALDANTDGVFRMAFMLLFVALYLHLWKPAP